MTIEAIAVAFSGIVLLWLVRVNIENRDKVRTIYQALFGIEGEKTPTGLVDRVLNLAATLDQHRAVEREFWDEVKEQRREITRDVVNAATVVMAEAQLGLGKQIDELRGKIEVLAERLEAR